MERQYKAIDDVLVYEKLDDYHDEGKKPIDEFRDRPYTKDGCDNYRYKDVMHMGYYNPRNGEVYIALDRPLQMMGGRGL